MEKIQERTKIFSILMTCVMIAFFSVLISKPYHCVAVTSVTVPNSSATPSGIKIIRSVKTLKAGKKFQFKTEKVSDLTVEWSVDNTDKATINNKGLFKAKKAGTVKVTAKTNISSETFTVKIEPKKVVAIDAGHQAKGNFGLEPIGPGASVKKIKVAGGTSGVYTKVPEYKTTLAVAKILKKQLVNKGYKVVMIRTKNDVNITNKERAIKANKSSDICIRIHADASGSSSVSGASALYPSSSNPYCGSISKKSKKLSEYVINNMCSESGAKNRGLVVRNDLTGTNWSSIPVTLIEMGFMTNKAEDIKLQDKDYQKKLAVGIVKGIEQYFGY